jgi:hypothetical protein
MQTISIPENIFTQPDLYPVELNNNEILFTQMTRESYFNSLFLDRNRIQSAQPAITSISIDSLTEKINEIGLEAKPVNFIFHTANCGSTLLSRALDVPTQSIAYREPSTLRQLGVAYTSLSTSNANLEQWNLRLKLAALLLSRRFSETEVPIIKANIPVNFMLNPLLSMFRASRSLLLYSDLESFLISVLKLPQRRAWVQNVAKSLTNVIDPPPGASIFNNNENFVPKISASLWVAQMQQYHKIVNNHDDIKSLTSDQLFYNTQDTLTSAANHLQLNLSTQEIIKIVDSSLFKQHSKNPIIEYNSDKRKVDHQAYIKTFAPEIAEGMRWGESLMEKYNISGTIKKNLI